MPLLRSHTQDTANFPGFAVNGSYEDSHRCVRHIRSATATLPISPSIPAISLAFQPPALRTALTVEIIVALPMIAGRNVLRAFLYRSISRPTQ
jgi:hypothetical protein